MTDYDDRDAALAAADGTRDAMAYLLAMASHDDEAADAVLFNCDALQTTASLAGFILFAVPDRARLRLLVDAWRGAAAGTEAEAGT